MPGRIDLLATKSCSTSLCATRHLLVYLLLGHPWRLLNLLLRIATASDGNTLLATMLIHLLEIIAAVAVLILIHRVVLRS